MKKIGIIGGLSPNSTMKYYQWLNEGMAERFGAGRSARIVLSSVDWAAFCELKERGDWDGIGQRLAAEAQALERAGADFIVLSTNTMHKVADRIEAAISVPFLHLADATAARIRAAGLTRVGLLGTSFTMEMDFYKKRLEMQGIEAIVPQSAEDRVIIHNVIYEELCRGQASEKARESYRGVMKRLAAQGAQGIILGCTEITLLIGPEDCEVPLFDTTRIHVEAALDLLTRPADFTEISKEQCA